MTYSLFPWVFRNSTSVSEVNNTANVSIKAKLRRLRLAVFWCGKAKIILYSDCVSVAFVSTTKSAYTVINCHLWPAWLALLFSPHYLISGTISGKKKIIEHKMCVLVPSTNLSENLSSYEDLREIS